MLMQEAREQLTEYGRRLTAEGLTSGTSGNLSMFDPAAGTMAISPSGMAYDAMTPADIVVMDLDGNVLDGERKPSSEHALHSAFYKNRPDVTAVVHAHSTYCTTLACMGEPLRPVHYAIADAGVSELPLVPYHTFGTRELADDVAAHLGGGAKGLLMANHGMLACGADMKSAFSLALTMEWCAEIQWRCMAAGRPNILTDEQMAAAIEAYGHYGQKKAGEKTGGYFG